MKTAKWGNSLAVRPPAAEVDVTGPCKLGMRRVDEGDCQALARLRMYRGRLPAIFKFDRLEANQRCQ